MLSHDLFNTIFDFMTGIHHNWGESQGLPGSHD